MTKLEQARRYDTLGEAAKAASFYLDASDANEPLTDEDKINAAVILLQTADYGYFVHHGFSEDVQNISWEKSQALLQSVRGDAELMAEAEFWNLYGGFAVAGKEAFEEQATALLKATTVPLILLIGWNGNEHYTKLARALLEKVTPPRSERDRLIISYLEKLPK